MDALFHAHSGLRYLVLLAAVVALAYFAWGTIARRELDRTGRRLQLAFTALLDLQVLLGLILFFGGRRPDGVLNHVGHMLLAVVAVHGTALANRRRARPAGFGLPLLGVALALALIAFGIHALGRPIL